jgi:prepilin-type N-terminal cleavage/methylation domain-containing protein
MDSRGFSLIELMMVVVVIGLVLTAGIPAFGTFRDGMVLVQARSQVTQDLRMARQVAVTRHCPVVVTFGDGSTTTNVGNYSILYDTNGDGAAATGELYFNRTMPNRTRLSSVSLTPTNKLTFDMSGVLAPGTGGGRLVFANSRGRVDTLLVSATGVVYRP